MGQKLRRGIFQSCDFLLANVAYILHEFQGGEEGQEPEEKRVKTESEEEEVSSSLPSPS